LSLLLGPLHAEPLYSLIDLGDLPGGDDYSRPYDINNRNQVVGESDGYDASSGNEMGQAFLWENGIMTGLGDFKGGCSCEGSVAYGINDAGMIVGQGTVCYTYFPPGSSCGRMVINGKLAFVYNDGQMMALDDYSVTTKGSSVWSINNAGSMVGWVGGGEYEYLQAAFVMEEGENIDQGQIIASPQAIAKHINNAGQVVGVIFDEGPFIWDEQNGLSMLDLPVSQLPNGREYSDGDIRDMNDGGVVVGYCGIYDGRSPGSWEASLWSDAAGPCFLGHLAGGRHSYAMGINNHNVVVGTEGFYDEPGAHNRAFLWEDDQMYDLAQLVDESGQGWELWGAEGINDNGWIIGYGCNPDGFSHGYILKPVPEPCSLSLFVLGALVLAERRRMTMRV